MATTNISKPGENITKIMLNNSDISSSVNTITVNGAIVWKRLNPPSTPRVNTSLGEIAWDAPNPTSSSYTVGFGTSPGSYTSTTSTTSTYITKSSVPTNQNLYVAVKANSKDLYHQSAYSGTAKVRRNVGSSTTTTSLADRANSYSFSGYSYSESWSWSIPSDKYTHMKIRGYAYCGSAGAEFDTGQIGLSSGGSASKSYYSDYAYISTNRYGGNVDFTSGGYISYYWGANLTGINVSSHDYLVNNW